MLNLFKWRRLSALTGVPESSSSNSFNILMRSISMKFVLVSSRVSMFTRKWDANMYENRHLTFGAIRPVLYHLIGTLGKIMKIQILQLLFACLKLVIWHEHYGRILPVGNKDKKQVASSKIAKEKLKHRKYKELLKGISSGLHIKLNGWQNITNCMSLH